MPDRPVPDRIDAAAKVEPVRRLVLLRHAKSDWPPGVDDVARPLAERGIRDATAAGRELAQIAEIAGLDAVLCSPARRTRQTWSLASAALDPTPPTRVVPELYGADVDDLLDVVRMVPHDVGTVLVIGHEPTMSGTATRLAGPGSDEAGLARLRAKYPTSAIAVFRLTGDWAGLERGGAVLERFLIPRG
jgi:phosphohistidine phosphatase